MGNIYFNGKATTNNTIKEISPDGVLLATYTASISNFTPRGICVDLDGNIWTTADIGNGVTKYAAGNLSSRTVFSVPTDRLCGICCDKFGNIWFADQVNSKIYKLDKANSYALSSFSSAPGSNAICSDKAGNIWTSNTTSSGTISKFDFSNAYARTDYNSIPSPEAICCDKAGNIYCVGENRIARHLKSNNFSAENFYAGYNNYGICIDQEENIFIRPYSNYIVKIDKNTMAGTNITTSYSGCGIAVDVNGNIWIQNDGQTQISKLTKTNNYAETLIDIGIAPGYNIGDFTGQIPTILGFSAPAKKKNNYIISFL